MAAEQTFSPDLFTAIETFFGNGIECVAAAPSNKLRELFSEELAAVERALPSRQQQYATGRWCARTALRRLNVADAAIGAGERGEPLWPQDVTGSITHCPGLCAAAVATKSSYAGIGIDAEPDTPLKPQLAARICTPQELASLPDASNLATWTKLVFSAKESVYKAHYPLTQTFLSFREVMLELEPEQTAFRAKVIKPGAQAEYSGRYLMRKGLIFTATLVSAD